MKFAIILFVSASVIVSCKTGSGAGGGDSHTTRKYEGNNSVEVKEKNVKHRSQNSQDEIQFEGKNNKVVIENQDSEFNNKNSKNVVIVKGDSNTIVVKQNNIKVNSTNSADTIIFEGTNDEIEFIGENFEDNSKGSHSTTVISDEEIEERMNDSIMASTKFIDIGIRTFLIENKVKEYRAEADLVQEHGIISLALCYYSGNFISKNCDSTIALLKRMPDSGLVLSLLADFYATGYCVPRNDDLAIKYYKQAAALDNKYSIEVLNEKKIKLD